MKTFAMMILAAISTVRALATSPTVEILACPATMTNQCTFAVHVHSVAGSFTLSSVRVETSWNGGSYTTVKLNNSPSSTVDYTLSDISTSPSSTGTLSVRATVTDSASQTGQDTKSVTVSALSGSGAPSWLNSVPGTYNYGSSWMYDRVLGEERLWWTAGNSSGSGDAIWYQTIYSGSPSQKITSNAYSNGLISDASVIRGSFSPSWAGGHTYTYAMYVAEGDNSYPGGFVLNDIGECYSDDGVTWSAMHASGVVSSQSYASGNRDYGAGYPSVCRIVNGSGTTLGYGMMFWDFSTANGRNLRYVASSDGVSWGTPSTVTTSGQTQPAFIGKCAFYDDGTNKYWYMLYGDTANPANDRLYVDKIQANSASSYAPTGSWSAVLSSPFYYSDSHGLPGRSTEGLRRDENGYVYGGGGAGSIAPSWHAENNSGNDNFFYASQIWYSQL